MVSSTLRLRQGASYCKYGDFLDRLLIKMLMHELTNRETCDKIVVKKPTSFTEAYKITHALEATCLKVKEVKNRVFPAESGVEITNRLLTSTQKLKHNKTIASKYYQSIQPHSNDCGYTCIGCGAAP